MSKTPLYNSLFFKLPALIILVMLCTGFVSLVVSRESVRQKAAENLEDMARLTLTSLDWAVASLISADDTAALQRLIENAGSNRFMSVLKVCSKEFRVLASSNPAEVGSSCDTDMLVSMVDSQKIISMKGFEYGTTYEAAIPVSGKHYDNRTGDSTLAVLYMQVNDSYVTGMLSSYKYFMLEYSVVLSLMLMLLLLLVFSKFILRPLRLFRGAVADIASGNYDITLEVKGDDEFSEFAKSLLYMSGEIKQKEAEFTSTNKHLAEYMKALDESSIVIRSSVSGKITYANRKFYELTGYSRKDIEGRSAMDFRGDVFEERGVLEYWDAVLKNFVWKETVAGVSKRGRQYYVSATVCPIQGADGEIIELIDVWHDITEIYELQTELKHHKMNLEAIVHERTADLESSQKRYKELYQEAQVLNTNLVQAQNTMVQQEKLASIGHLAAGVAHELNNPIGFISSNYDVMKNYFSKIENYVTASEEAIGRLSDKCDGSCGLNIGEIKEELISLKASSKVDYILGDTRDIFEESEHGFQRVTSIINSLRDFSRVDYDEKRAMYDINEGIKNTLIISKNETKYIAELETELSPLPEIMCNGGEINQVLLNILINASHALKEVERQTGRILIKTFLEKGMVCCTIADNGEGIPDEHIHRIFDPFFTTKEPGSGTGLGLSISYDIIVNKHSGMLSVDRADGWTVFKIALPAAA